MVSLAKTTLNQTTFIRLTFQFDEKNVALVGEKYVLITIHVLCSCS